MSGLKRYTQLPQLLHMLESRTITLLSPTTWDDKNDTYFIEKYRKHKNLKSVLALCLTEASATYHHWHVFAGGLSGVRIEFHQNHFEQWAAKIPCARVGCVRYARLKEAELKGVPVYDLPFLKRYAFRDEKEVRLITDQTEDKLAMEYPFDYSMIKGIITSPWLPGALYKSVEASILRATGGRKLRIRPTTMLNNRMFQATGDNRA